MHKGLAVLIGTVLAISTSALAVATKAKPKPKPVPTIQFELATTFAGNPPREMIRRVYIKGSKRRIESAMQKVKMVQLLINDSVVHWQVGQKEAMRFRLAKGRGLPLLPTDLPDFWKNAKKTGSEKLNSKDCDVYSYQPTIPGGPPGVPAFTAPTIKVWVWRERKLAIKTMTEDTGQPARTTEVRKLVVDKPLQDSLFQLPKGVKIKDAPEPPVSSPPPPPAR